MKNSHDRHLLVAVYDYPPSTSVGGIRWLTMKKYLERLGYRITVLTTNAYGHLPTDEAERIVRAPDLAASGRLRGVLRRPNLPQPGQEVPVDRAPPALLTKVVVPDIYALSWIPSAARAMRRILRDDRIDALITTSPKDSTHLLGLTLRGSGPPWVADFRDGWVFESTRPPLPTSAQRALDRKLERLVVSRADSLVAFSEILASDFNRRLGRHAVHVSNGWDPELAALAGGERSENVLEPVRAGGVRLVYTGTLSGAEGAPTDRSPLPLLEALDELNQEDPELAQRLELVIVGRRSERDEAMLSRFIDLGLVKHLGHLPRETALVLQRQADVLVLVSGSTPSSIPLKLFEYLGAGRPILHLGRPGSAARILEETRAGTTVSPDTAAEMVEELRRIARREFFEPFSPRQIEQYSYPYVAERMAEAIEEAISRRGGVTDPA